MRSNTIVALSILFSLFACDQSEETVEPNESEGFFILNEGSFGNSNASLSYFDRESESVENDVFLSTNSFPLGDQSQSMEIVGTLGFIVVQNSGKIEVISTEDFTSVATISDGLISPRYFQAVSEDKAYVSDWGTFGSGRFVKVIDLNTFMVVDSVETGLGPDALMRVNEEVFVCNSGAFGSDSTVSVINSVTDEVIATIQVGYNPNSLTMDASGDIWVANSGLTIYDQNFNIIADESKPGSLSKISGNQEVLQLSTGRIATPVSNLISRNEGEELAYTFDQAVYSFSYQETSLPGSSFLDVNAYALEEDPQNGNLIVLMAPDFSSAGTMEIYSSDGSLIDSYSVGIAPNDCAFQ